MLSSVIRLTFFLSAFYLPVAAQRDSDPSLPGSSFEISGQVRASTQHKTVANVMVRLEKFSGELVDQISTDGTGRFRFSRLRPGQYIVSARVEGFSTKTPQLDISRFIPRQYVILQLQPEEATFRRDIRSGVVDVKLPPEATEEFEKGQNALRTRKPEEAVAHFEKAIRLAPTFFDAQVLLGSAYMELRNWDKAEQHLRRGLEIKPKESGPFIYLGEVYRRQKKYLSAESALVEGLRLNRASWQGHFTMGRVYWEKGEVTKAAPHVGQAIELRPDYPEARLLAGNIFLRLNMPQNALIEYEEYLRLAPDGEFAVLTRENVAKLKKNLTKR